MESDSQAATDAGGAAAPVGSVSGDSGVTADDVQRAVSEALAESSQQSEVVTLTSAEDVLRHVPQDFPQYVSGYLTPFLWGMAAGFVAFLIGFTWDAFMRLLGLASRK